ncbi:MAG: hypothetical protein ABI565_02150 [Vicinamibacteria bacterium]
MSALAAFGLAMVVPPGRPAQAAQPVILSSANSTKITVTAVSLTDTIDALARAAHFRVTYEGARPTGMLFNAEIDTPSVAGTLARLLEGQNLNYGIVFDLSGRQVTLLMILGPASKLGGVSGAGSAPPRPQPFTTPRSPRNDLPPVDDDPEEVAAEPEPSPAPAPSATPGGAPVSPFRPPPSPFAPRPFGLSPGAPPQPTPSPLA